MTSQVYPFTCYEQKLDQVEKAKKAPFKALSVPSSQFGTLGIDSLQRAQKEVQSLKTKRAR